jgi:hypothetical protein
VKITSPRVQGDSGSVLDVNEAELVDMIDMVTVNAMLEVGLYTWSLDRAKMQDY